MFLATTFKLACMPLMLVLMNQSQISVDALKTLIPQEDPSQKETRELNGSTSSTSSMSSDEHFSVPIADAYIWSGNRATRNYGSKSRLILRKFQNDRKAVLKFDLRDHDTTLSDLSKATLHLHVENVGSDPSRSIAVTRLAEAPSWDEISVTWTTLDAVVPEQNGPSFNVVPSDSGTWIEVDVSNLVQTCTGTMLVMMLEITSSNNRGSRCDFSSRETGVYSPKLVFMPGDTLTPTGEPTPAPTPELTTVEPTAAPTETPTVTPTDAPTEAPTVEPTTDTPTYMHTEEQTEYPTPTPTQMHTTSSSGDENEDQVDQPPIFKLGTPMMGGTGCPSVDSVGVMATPDGSKVTIMFQDYWAETDAYAGKTRDRKNCALSIPVEVLPGYSIGIFQADYRGYVDVPDVDGFEATFNAEYFFAGTWGEQQSTTWEHGAEGDFVLTDHVGAVAMSRCGDEEHNLRINTSIVAKGRGGSTNDSVLIQVDTSDITNPFSAHIPLDELGPMFSFGIQTEECGYHDSPRARVKPRSGLRTFQP